MQLVECVPNFSDGRRAAVIAAIRAAAESVHGVTVLDLHTDSAHNRMVLTFVGTPQATLEGAFRCAEQATRLIDLREHRGEHPRIGATDVVPFVPVSGVSMQQCVALATQLGQRLGSELGLPVYLYAEAARRPERRWLPTVRKGQYEGLRDVIATDPGREPDFGPRRLGPAGATAVGARPFLIAYNVNLATSDLAIAKTIAKGIRQSSGGLPAVQARGMATGDRDVVQVSMNLLDTEITPLHVAYEAVRSKAASHGVCVTESEIVGLTPLGVVTTTAGTYVSSQLAPTQVLEARLLEKLVENVDRQAT